MTLYYVATTGSDSNPGTSTLPFASLSKACTMMQSGDEIDVRAGTYVDQSTANVSGKSNFKIYGTPAGAGNEPNLRYRGGVNFASNAIKVVGSNNFSIEGIFFSGNNSEISYSAAKADYDADPNTFDARYDMNGVVIETSYSATVKSCRVGGFPGGGIFFKDCDLVTADSNIVRNCTNFSKFGCQGISFLGAVNSPGAVSGRNGLQALGNTVENCVNQIPWNVTNTVNEGNGIYSDTTKQNLAKTVTYTGKYLFRGNTVNLCGSAAFHALNSCPGQIDRNFTSGNRRNVEVLNGDIQVNNSQTVLMYENDFTIANTNRNYISVLGNSNIAATAFKFNTVRGTTQAKYQGSLITNNSNTFVP